MSVNSNVVSITVTNSGGGTGGGTGGGNCNCPTSEVCANSNGTCPSGTFPDNYNIGCCIPCNQLIPYAITDVNVENVNVYAYMNVYDKSVHPSCSTCYTSCKTNNQTFSFNVTGKLVDSDGHGICGAQISAYNNTDLVTVVTYNIMVEILPSTATVTWSFKISSGSGITDSNGNFQIELEVESIQVQNESVDELTTPNCYPADGPNIVPFLVNINVPNTTIATQAPGQIIFYSSISKPL